MSDMLENYAKHMEALAKKTEPFKVQIPEGQQGDWTVAKFEAKIDISAMRALRDGRPVPPGFYTRLSKKGTGLFMTDTPAELSDADFFIRGAGGHVLITGLGLGMVPRILMEPQLRLMYTGSLYDRHVESVTILELEQDVIDLVAPHMEYDDLEVICADARTWRPPSDKKFDIMWHDIWPHMCSDQNDEMDEMEAHYEPYMAPRGEQLFWGDQRRVEEDCFGDEDEDEDFEYADDG